jgi:hypothetical protein
MERQNNLFGLQKLRESSALQEREKGRNEQRNQRGRGDRKEKPNRKKLWPFVKPANSFRRWVFYVPYP